MAAPSMRLGAPRAGLEGEPEDCDRAVAQLAQVLLQLRDQAAFLQKIDCACAQGFLYCVPLPPRDLEKMLNKPLEIRMVAAPTSAAAKRPQ